MNTTNASTNMRAARRPLAAPIPSQSLFSVIYPPGGCAGIPYCFHHCLVAEDREDQRPVCQCLNLPSGWGLHVPVANRRSVTLAPDDLAQTLRPPIWAVRRTISLPESADITQASPNAG